MVQKKTDGVLFLTLLLGVVVTLLLLGLQLFLLRKEPYNGALATTTGIITNILSVLLIGFVTFLVFTRKGISLPTAEQIAREVRNEAAASGPSDSDLASKGVADFFPSFRSVPWNDYIDSAQHIDIVVYYFDSWVKANWEALVAFFSRSGTINLYLPDPSDERAVAQVAELFPEYDVALVKRKIENTSTRFEEALAESGSRSGRVDTFHVPRPPLYSAIRLNRDRVVLSVYENYRQQKIDSSAIVLDLRSQATLRNYWDKEFGGFMTDGSASPG